MPKSKAAAPLSGDSLKFKRIKDYTPADLNVAIGIAVDRCERINIDFYDILRGVDAYFEKRKRKEAAEGEQAHQKAVEEIHGPLGQD